MLVCTVDLLTGAYDASVGTTHSEGPRQAEWPPAPARMFCGLVSVHDRVPGGEAALRWLEAQPPPVIGCSNGVQSKKSAFVVTNAIDPKSTHAFHPGRRAAGQQRIWPRTSPAVPRVQFVWADAEPNGQIRDALRQLCRRVPYLGRATSVAVFDIDTDVDARLERWLPSAGARELVRVPYSGYLDSLISAFAMGDEHHDLAHSIGYVREIEMPSSDEVSESPFSEVMTIRLDGPRFDGAHTVRVAGYLRDALRARGADLPAVHGHDRGPQVAFLAPPNVGAEHSDGSFGSLGLALPRGLSRDQAVQIKRTFLELTELPCGPLGVLRLDRDRDRDRSSEPHRWVESSTCWVTATPIVLGRFPRRSEMIDDEIKAEFELAGYPRPDRVETSITPIIEGGVSLSPKQAVRQRAGERPRPLPYRHVQAWFAAPVAGPVLVGKMRFYGVGLMAPNPRAAYDVHRSDGEESSDVAAAV